MHFYNLLNKNSMKFMKKIKLNFNQSIIALLCIVSLFLLKSFIPELSLWTILKSVLCACLYILGQYIVFNKLFSRYSFYSNHKKTVNGLVISSPSLYYIFSSLWVCSYQSCGDTGIGIFMNMIMVFVAILLMSLTYFIISGYDYFIKKTNNKLKKIIDIVSVLMALVILFYLRGLLF